MTVVRTLGRGVVGLSASEVVCEAVHLNNMNTCVATSARCLPVRTAPMRGRVTRVTAVATPPPHGAQPRVASRIEVPSPTADGALGRREAVLSSVGLVLTTVMQPTLAVRPCVCLSRRHRSARRNSLRRPPLAWPPLLPRGLTDTRNSIGIVRTIHTHNSCRTVPQRTDLVARYGLTRRRLTAAEAATAHAGNGRTLVPGR